MTRGRKGRNCKNKMGHLHIACFLSGNKAIQRGGGRELVGTVALPTETDLCV